MRAIGHATETAKRIFVSWRECPCIKHETPLCWHNCWHFGMNKGVCIYCGEGNRAVIETVFSTKEK